MKCGDRVIQEEIFDRADKKIVTSRQDRSYKQHASIRNCSMIPGLLALLTVNFKIKMKNIEQLFSSLSLENLKNSSELDKTPQFKINNRRVLPSRAFPSQDNSEDTLKKSPSTPNLNWRYAVTEDTIRVNSGVTGGGGGGGGGGGVHSQDIVVKRRPKKAPRPRPRSEFRERGSDETWIDGER